MEIQKVKNEATRIYIPVIDSASPELYLSGTVPTITAYYSDSGAAASSLTIGALPTELGTTGVFELVIAQAEINHDLIIIKISGTGIVDDTLLIYTGINSDTNELQTDWVNGGRLDLLVDAIKVVTDNLPESGTLATLLSNVSEILIDTSTTLDDKIDAIKIETDKIQKGIRIKNR